MADETPRKPKITQAMIDAYDEYTHLTLDRRGFMAKLTALAGSATAAAAIAPLIGASKASAQIVDPQDERVTTVWAKFLAAGAEMKAYVAKPTDAEGTLPGVLVIHENRGLNAHIQDVARRLALEGFVAVAPDFLSTDGGTPPDEDKAREMIGALDGAKTVESAVAAREWATSEAGTTGQVGAVGFCWGGGLVNSLAVTDPELGAGVAYYGRQPDAADVAKIKAPMLLHYAGLDERINAGIDAYKAALEAAGVEHAIVVHEGVNHAFNNDTSAARYDKAAADSAWEQTVAFLKQHLGGG
ncbi:dienelactone hydrolase family protein [Aurantimonas sp. C2-6-R+9]|uniref:dienelactone hydrolase family protein n=1 Tax=unclassified Aurantimonas TaxID=2638230 RepID=UPI002E1812D0|nr:MULTISPECIES: dienelactone hydrolase family protein [unclassified Aurantimonas]MEC5290485.1 dienelactone hydrolase family protein [Aurantimonas sp. C2-3-R2]MEC5380506.1 dienelactone hydrolase family protein [Aurantimonas sp. C2-6-R+9]MEC5411552.1 dienelactone hydrolase family protein [Aurantimonas sp. C2-4-R8]